MRQQLPPTLAHVPAGSPEVVTRVQILLQAAWHVRSESEQCWLYESLVNKARSHIKKKYFSFSETYTFVVDYSQNIMMLCCGENQPVDMNYFTPLRMCIILEC